MNNPILNEIRELRNEHAKQFNYDVMALSLYYDKRHNQTMQDFEKIKNNFKNLDSVKKFSLPIKNEKQLDFEHKN